MRRLDLIIISSLRSKKFVKILYYAYIQIIDKKPNILSVELEHFVNESNVFYLKSNDLLD